MPLRSVWTDVDGCRMHCRAGDVKRTARPVVMVHGWGVSGTYFVPAAERLATDFSVYVPDLPGHGRSATPAVSLDVSGHAHVLVRWMHSMSIDSAALVGQSMGCQIAIEAALRFPDRVDRLVLLGPTVDASARALGRLFWRLVRAGLHERAALIPTVVRDYVRMRERLVPEFKAMLADRPEEKLLRLALPAMVLRGEHDAIAPARWVAQVAQLLRTDRLAVIPGAAHAAQFSAPEAFAAAITPFLRQNF